MLEKGDETAANTAANAAPDAATDSAGGTDSALDAKEAERTAAFRLLRAKKILLALADGAEDEDSD